MVLAEFVEQRRQAQAEINKYLKDVWGISSYHELAPVILLALGEKGPLHVEPLNLDAREPEYWHAVAMGDPSNLSVSSKFWGGPLLEMSQEMKQVLESFGPVQYRNGEEGSILYSPQELVIHSQTSEISEDLDLQDMLLNNGAQKLYYFGRFREPYSGSTKRYCLVDFRGEVGKWDDREQFQVAVWLKAHEELFSDQISARLPQ